MNIDDMDVDDLREMTDWSETGTLTTDELRSVLGVYHSWPKEIKKLTEMINEAVRKDDKRKLNESTVYTPEEIRDLLTELLT